MRCIIIATLSADGYIAKDSHHYVDWSSKADKGTFELLSRQAGVMIMGSNTFATINRALPGRRTIVYTRHSEKITVPDIETTSEAPDALLKRLESEGATAVAICGGTEIYTMFMQAGLVDELFLVTEPVILGSGISLFDGAIDQPIELFETTVRGGRSVVNHFIRPGLKMRMGAKAPQQHP